MRMVESQNLCKLLFYDTNTSTDPLNLADLSEEQRYGLIMDRIFPIPKIPKVDDTAKSFVTIHFDRIKLNNTNHLFKDSIIVFNIFCHIDLWLTPAKIRPYSIANEIDILFNEQRLMGIGKLLFDRADPIAANNNYMGYKVSYNVVDFN